MKRWLLPSILLLFPATAWAIKTSPAVPSTISITGNGYPKCTILKYHLDKFAARVDLSVHAPDNTRFGANNYVVPAGDRSFRWCADVAYREKPQHALPGTWHWRVVRQNRLGQAVSTSTTRTFEVVP